MVQLRKCSQTLRTLYLEGNPICCDIKSFPLIAEKLWFLTKLNGLTLNRDFCTNEQLRKIETSQINRDDLDTRPIARENNRVTYSSLAGSSDRSENSTLTASFESQVAQEQSSSGTLIKG